MLKKKAKYTISIPEPCHEDWDKMTPVERGKFCDVCSKNVRDFTRSSDQTIANFFNEKPENSCGRFRIDQLNRPLRFKTEEHNYWRKAVAILALTSGTVIANGQSSEHPESNIENSITRKEINFEHPNIDLYDSTLNVTISGRIIDTTGESLIYAPIIVNDLDTNHVLLDINGEFKFDVKKKPKRTILKIVLAGYEEKTINVELNSTNINIGTIIMENISPSEIEEIPAEKIIMGGARVLLPETNGVKAITPSKKSSKK